MFWLYHSWVNCISCSVAVFSGNRVG